MGWFTKKKVKDERVTNLQNKIYKEVYSVVIILCTVSTMVKHYYFGLEIEHLLTEIAILFISGMYYLYRSIQIGLYSDEVEMHDRDSKWPIHKKFTIGSIIGGLGIAIFMGLNSAIRYGGGGGHAVYTFLLVFITTLFFYTTVLVIIFVIGHEIAKSRSDKVIKKQLEEPDGDDDEKY